ncbi:hypothetical protein L3X38_016293 [Prunus dulcis]|uniref:F-box domain-containing protein n=1 Tax=Prunus dulcis TaxID=3755 RepID=A0AAD4W6N0_PRUDU|nr:hypothetical protein L3X38_016293 [Prunus dulcis]
MAETFSCSLKMGMGNAQILSCLLPKTLTRFKCVSKWWCALISSPEFVVKHVQHNSDPDNNILSSSSTCTVLLRRLLVDDVVCESRPRTQPRKHIIHGFEDQDTKSVVFSVLNFFCYCCIANSDHCHCTNIDPLRFLSSFEDMDMTNLKQPLIDKEKTFRIVGHCDGIICVQLNAAEAVLWNPAVYTIMNRADPASKRLAPKQPRLLPCRRKTHFRGARHLPKLSAAKPNLQDTCRHHNGLHKVPHWNFVQSSHFHFPINREQYPGKTKNDSPTFTVPHQPISPRASALFPAEDPAHIITKLDSILAGPF